MKKLLCGVLCASMLLASASFALADGCNCGNPGCDICNPPCSQTDLGCAPVAVETGVVEQPTQATKVTSTNTFKTASDADASMVYTVKRNIKSRLCVRTRPKEGARVLARLYAGEEIYVIQYGREWSMVTFNGYLGYVHSQYIEFERYNLPEEYEEIYKVSVLAGDTLEVRSEPSTRADVIYHLVENSYVAVAEDEDEIAVDGWVRVYYNTSESGYVQTRYLTKVNIE